MALPLLIIAGWGVYAGVKKARHTMAERKEKKRIKKESSRIVPFSSSSPSSSDDEQGEEGEDRQQQHQGLIILTPPRDCTCSITCSTTGELPYDFCSACTEAASAASAARATKEEEVPPAYGLPRYPEDKPVTKRSWTPIAHL